MKTNISIEQFSSEENPRYDEYTSFDKENPLYREYVVFPTDNSPAHEFADDEVLAATSARERTDKRDKSSSENAESDKRALGNTAGGTAVNGASAIVAKIAAGLSTVSMATVTLFVVIAVYVLDIIPGFSPAFYKIQSFQIMPGTVICNIWIKPNVEERRDVHACLYSEDEDYYDSVMLSDGDNMFEFYGLTPDADYVFEIKTYDNASDEVITVYSQKVRTPSEEGFPRYEILFLGAMQGGIMGEVRIDFIPENSCLLVHLYAHDQSFDEYRELFEEMNKIEFWELTPNTEYVLEIVYTRADDTEILYRDIMYTQGG